MPELLTNAEAAEYLRCHPDTLRAKAPQWGVPRLKRGGAWIYRRVELQRWVEEQADKTVPKGRRPRRPRRCTDDAEAERRTLERLGSTP